MPNDPRLRSTKKPTSYDGTPTYPELKTISGSLTVVSIELTVVVFPVTVKLPVIETLEFKLRLALKTDPTKVPGAIFW